MSKPCTFADHKALLAGIVTLEDLGAALERLRPWPGRPNVIMGDCPRCHSSFSVDLGDGLTVSVGSDSPEALEDKLAEIAKDRS
jgi:hypothetical protein